MLEKRGFPIFDPFLAPKQPIFTLLYATGKVGHEQVKGLCLHLMGQNGSKRGQNRLNSLACAPQAVEDEFWENTFFDPFLTQFWP